MMVGGVVCLEKDFDATSNDSAILERHERRDFWNERTDEKDGAWDYVLMA